MENIDLYEIENKKTPTLSDLVFIQLKTLIVEGYFKEGEKLSTENIRKRLNVSRMPVREAFRKLESEGLVVVHPQIGVIVSDISIKEFNDLTDMRILLEKYAVQQALKNMTGKDYEALEKTLVREAEKDLKFTDKIKIRNEFHLELYKYANNQILLDQINKIYEKFIRYLYLHAQYVKVPEKYNHRYLIEVFRNQDIQKALNVFEEHIRSLAEEIEKILIIKSKK